jgi:hypothetical protein
MLKVLCQEVELAAPFQHDNQVWHIVEVRSTRGCFPPVNELHAIGSGIVAEGTEDLIPPKRPAHSGAPVDVATCQCDAQLLAWVAPDH